nr:hypothetical protein [uncultured bacterium]
MARCVASLVLRLFPDLARRAPGSFRGSWLTVGFSPQRAFLAACSGCARLPRLSDSCSLAPAVLPPSGLTIRSSRTRIGAPPGCFSATLAPSRRPAAGRLNSGVRPHGTRHHRSDRAGQ